MREVQVFLQGGFVAISVISDAFLVGFDAVLVRGSSWLLVN